jgi:hypothetical protein
MGDMANARQRLAPKTIGGDRRKIFEGFQLGRGESLAQDGQIVALGSSQQGEKAFCDRFRLRKNSYIYAMAIVRDLQQLETSVLDQDFDGRRTSVDGVFDQLLQRMHGSNDYLSRGDLIDHIRIQSL